jgi:hypothetical protein
LLSTVHEILKGPAHSIWSPFVFVVFFSSILIIIILSTLSGRGPKQIITAYLDIIFVIFLVLCIFRLVVDAWWGMTFLCGRRHGGGPVYWIIVSESV